MGEDLELIAAASVGDKRVAELIFAKRGRRSSGATAEREGLLCSTNCPVA